MLTEVLVDTNPKKPAGQLERHVPAEALRNVGAVIPVQNVQLPADTEHLVHWELQARQAWGEFTASVYWPLGHVPL